MEQAEDIRHTIGMKELYGQRKQTIERVFADAKEKHGMRYTQYRGLAKLKMELNLLFSCMNLKKMAIWKWRKKWGSKDNSPNTKVIKHTRLIFINIKTKWFQGIILKPLCLQSEVLL